jgi:hypothetical protein
VEGEVTTVVIVTAVLLALRMVLNSRWSRVRIGAGITKWAWFNIDLKKGSRSAAPEDEKGPGGPGLTNNPVQSLDRARGASRDEERRNRRRAQ